MGVVCGGRLWGSFTGIVGARPQAPTPEQTNHWLQAPCPNIMLSQHSITWHHVWNVYCAFLSGRLLVLGAFDRIMQVVPRTLLTGSGA